MAMEPKLVVIMISGFKDYEFVREAFRIGAKDYVLKSNMQFESLVSLLEHNIGHKSFSNYEEPRKYTMLAYEKSKIIENLFFGILPENLGQTIKELNVPLSPRNIAVAVLSIDDYRLLQDKFDSVILMKIIESAHHLIHQRLLEFKIGECYQLSQDRYALLVHFPNANSQSSFQQQRLMFFQQLQGYHLREFKDFIWLRIPYNRR